MSKRSRVIAAQVLCAAEKRKRARSIFYFGLAWLTVIAGRLLMLQVTRSSEWVNFALKQHKTSFKLAAVRGAIRDRTGRALALSIPAASVFAHPHQINDKESVASTLSPILGVDAKSLLIKLDSSKPFVWLERTIPLDRAKEIPNLRLKGIGYYPESKRVYPRYDGLKVSNLSVGGSGTLIGRIGRDGLGLSGIERQYDKHLVVDESKLTLTRDASGKLIHRVAFLGGEQFAPKESWSFGVPTGNDLTLTIDSEFQNIISEELARGMREHRAKGAMAVLVDSSSGEILSMTQVPNDDISKPLPRKAKLMKNLVAETVLEPGSVIKPLVAAAGLEEGVVGVNEIINCEKGHYKIGRHMINDVHPVGLIPFWEVIVRSSNIGTLKVGERLGKERLYRYLRAFGFGEGSGANLIGESRGILRHPKGWATVDVATHSYGQGVAVTPLQMARAVSVIANGGELVPLTLIKGAKKGLRYRVISEETASTVRGMMIKVVEHKHGTGTNALVPGVKVGGKTGTAQKARLVGRGYESGKYISSFVGFIEADTLGISEKLTFVVSVDEPRAKGYYGGVVAAPIFQRAMVRILNTLAIRRALKTNDESGPGAKGRKFDSREDVTDTRPEVAIETTTLKRSL